MTESTDITPLRPDLAAIADLIHDRSRVLDVGCGSGDLLIHLRQSKAVDGRGIELSQSGVNACVAKGLSVIQGDADTDLKDYPTNAFDVVVLSQTLQATKNPKGVMRELMRIGESVVVSFPNFGHWRVRLDLALRGRMPVTHALGESWYRTPNIHLCTILDFLDLCAALNAKTIKALSLSADGHIKSIEGATRKANLLSEQAIFLIQRSD